MTFHIFDEDLTEFVTTIIPSPGLVKVHPVETYGQKDWVIGLGTGGSITLTGRFSEARAFGILHKSLGADAGELLLTTPYGKLRGILTNFDDSTAHFTINGPVKEEA